MTQRSAKKTTDHEQIKHWVEDRGGWPASVKGTGGKEDVGLLRIDFPEKEPDIKLQKITWDEFFDKFEEKKLAFLYQEEGESRFFKLVSREAA